MSIHTLSRAAVLAALLASAALAANAGEDRIQPWEEDPRYWQYGGEPVLLLGATDTDALFQWEEDPLVSQLDLLVESGGNYIRNVMSSRSPDERGDVFPWAHLGDGQYDLDQWNEEYWRRFERMLEETAARDVIVSIELWDGHDVQSRSDTPEGFSQWAAHPLNPANNMNYSAEDTTIPDIWTIGYPNETHPILLTVPELNDDAEVLAYQNAFIARILDHALDYDHVLYVIQNETWVDPAWSDYWAGFIRGQAAERDVEVQVADMEFTPSVDPVLERGFDFGELSQSASGAGRASGVNAGQQHFDFIAAELAKLAEQPAPVNSVKQYGGDLGWTLGPDEGVDRVWRTIFAGQAAVRFHRPGGGGIGLNERAQANLTSLRMVTDYIDVFTAQSHQDLQNLLSNRAVNEAYIMGDSQQGYAVFFTQEGAEVELDVSAIEGDVRVRWLDVNTAEWNGDWETFSEETLTLSKPGDAQWAVLITRGS